MLDPRSEKNLLGVHDDLCRIVRIAACYEGPTVLVTEGLRTLERQKKLLEAGLSQTLESRHITGHAVDLCVVVDGVARWDWPCFRPLADRMKSAARELKLRIEWGGDWKKFKDGPHFHLPREFYP